MAAEPVGALVRRRLLAEWFHDLGLFHPDDMSSILLHSLRRSLRDEPLGLEARVAEYREAWRVNSYPEKARCPTHRLRRLVWTESQPHPTDESRRIHWFECSRKRELWAYEVDVGFYEPGRELAAGVRRLRHIQGPRRYSGCQVPVDRPFRPSSYDQIFAAEVEDVVAWPPDQGSRVDSPIDESRVPIRSLRLHPVASWKGVSPEVRGLWADAATHFLAKDIGYSVAIDDVFVFFADSVTESERVLVRGFCNYDPLNLPPAPESDSWYVKHGRLAPWMTRPKWIRSTVESDP